MDKEPLPDTTNTFKALSYVQKQAAHGHFKGHSTALLVLYYLVMNMWARQSGNQGPGEVMEGKSGIDTIAEGTALCRRAVQNALNWLAEEEWINMQRQIDPSGREIRRYIYVRLDMPGHRERERRRTMAAAAERILAEAGRP